jgi:tetratricopeptide (TPR) repeat protein
MRMRSFLIGLTLAVVLGSAGVAFADNTAAQLFANGQALLAKADFDGALEAFKGATKAEPENSEYFQEYSLLRRVLNLRTQLKDEEDQETWQKMSRALFNYYRSHGINNEALAVATSLHAKVNSGETAALVADAQLELGQNEAAATLLAGLAKDQGTLQTNILHGIALARLGKLAEAKALLGTIEVPKDCDGQTCFDAARLNALVGNTVNALNLLKCAFETTPANQLDAVKADAKASKDLSKVITDAGFAQVLETKSKVAAGGCGKCPSKAACAGKAKEGEAAGCKEHEKQAEKAPACDHDKKDK